MPSRRPTAVVADDDRLARERIKDLNAEVDLVDIVGEAADGRSALELIEEVRPDIAFLDVRMPVLNGLEVLESLEHQPAVIFTTAHGEFAVRAFELAAVDYLLKPFGPDRFRKAVVRACDARGSDDSVPTAERMRSVLDAAGVPLSRLFVRERDTIIPVVVRDIVRLESDGDYVMVHTTKRRHMMRASLQDLEASLGDRFLRVHRSHVVNLDQVVRFEPHDVARLDVVLTDGSTVVASRSRSQDLRKLAR